MEFLAVFAWGDNSDAQCFVDPSETQSVTAPRRIDSFTSARKLPRAGNACGDCSWFINQNGALFASGSNSQNFISTNEPESSKISSALVDYPELQLQNLVAISSGKDHAVAITDGGVAMSWGRSNEFGQLGHLGSHSMVPSSPRMIQGLRGISVVSVACGENFTILLTEEGKIYSCGANNHGQLGHGHVEPINAPLQISAGKSRGVAFRKIAAGADHCLAISLSGTVYAWGSNKHEKCGVSVDDSILTSPVTVPFDRTASHIACGEGHSMVVAGDLWTFGDNRYGQCGIGSFAQTSPVTRVAISAKLLSISGGARHSLAVLADGHVLGWGDNSVGQLGIEGGNRSEPTKLSIDRAVFVAAGSYHSVAACSTGETPLERSTTSRPTLTPQTDEEALPMALSQGSVDRLSLKFSASPFPLAGSHPCGSFAALSVARLFSLSADTKQLTRALTKAFDDEVILGASLLVPRLRRPQFDAEAAVRALKSIPRECLSHVRDAVIRMSHRIATDSTALTSADQLRFLLPIIVLIPLLNDPICSQLVFGMIAGFPAEGKHTLLETIKSQLSSHAVILPIIDTVRAAAERFISDSLTLPPEELPPNYVSHALLVLQMLRSPSIEGKRFELSALTKFDDSQVMPTIYREVFGWRRFWSSRGQLPLLSDLLKADFINDARMCLLLPFSASLPATFKQKILNLDNNMMQAAAGEELFHSQPMMIFSLLAQGMRPVAAHVLKIRRDFVVADATRQLTASAPAQLRLPLKIVFDGEDGVDEGGVAREFFVLLGRNLFNPDFGMFSQSGESRVLWFSPAAAAEGLAHSQFFHVVGRLFGLAVYNNLSGLSAPFPLALFRHLRGERSTLEDAAEIFPELVRSFRTILDWAKEGDFESTFGVYFSASYDFYGENRVVDLIDGGRDIPVSFSRRYEFVDLYVRWLLHDSVKSSLDYVSEGFASVTGSGLALAAFTADDLRSLICGQGGEIQISLLRSNAKYEGGFTDDDPYIADFWNALDSMDESQKRKFLVFVTGSDRLPLGGLSGVTLTIQQNGAEPTDHLPTAYTCYSVLLLPRYANKDKLQRFLLTAVENSEGFGLR